MRKLWLLAPIVLSVLLTSTDCSAKSASAETSSPVILPANTDLILRLTKSLHKKDAKPGQPVEFEVAYDVVLNGQILIEGGTSVTESFRVADNSPAGRQISRLGMRSDIRADIVCHANRIDKVGFGWGHSAGCSPAHLLA